MVEILESSESNCIDNVCKFSRGASQSLGKKKLCRSSTAAKGIRINLFGAWNSILRDDILNCMYHSWKAPNSPWSKFRRIMGIQIKSWHRLELEMCLDSNQSLPTLDDSRSSVLWSDFDRLSSSYKGTGSSLKCAGFTIKRNPDSFCWVRG